MNLALFAQAIPPSQPAPQQGDWFQNNYGWVIVGIVVLLAAIFFLVVFFSRQQR